MRNISAKLMIMTEIMHILRQDRLHITNENEDYIKGTYLIDRDVSVTGNGVYKQIMTDIVTVDLMWRICSV